MASSRSRYGLTPDRSPEGQPASPERTREGGSAVLTARIARAQLRGLDSWKQLQGTTAVLTGGAAAAAQVNVGNSVKLSSASEGSSPVRKSMSDTYLVRRMQRKLALAYRHPDLSSYVQRDSVARVADQLAQHFFPLAVRRGHAAAEAVRDMYKHWLVAAPVSDKVAGYWRPWWTRQVLVTWLRQHINGRKARHWLGWLPWDWNQPLSVELGAKQYNVFDDDWLSELAEFVSQSNPNTIRGQLARQLTGPFVWATEAKDLLQECRSRRSGLWWWEDGAVVLSNKPWDYPRVEWFDLREQHVDLLKYRISAPDGYLRIEMAPETVEDLKTRIRRILDSGASPQHKLNLVNRYVASWYAVAKYAYAAKPQAWNLESWIWKRVSKQILATKPSLKGKYFNLKEASWKTHLAFQKRDSLLDLDRQKLPDEQWKMFWNPRR